MKRCLCLGLVLVSTSAFAEPQIVTIPTQGWHLVVEAPPLTSSESTTVGGRFSYTGADGNSGITFSIHTEDARGGSHKECRDEYWKRTQASPYIIKGSAELFETPALLGVTYRSEGEYKGKRFALVNSHGYFVKNGKCVDLHVSQIPYSPEDIEAVERIVRTSKILQ